VKTFKRKVFEKCAWPGCDKLGDAHRGMCNQHYVESRRLGLDGPPKPEFIPWSYEGNEAALDAMVNEKQESEQEKQNV